MTTPVFRLKDELQVLPFREWIRENLPHGRSGVVVEDLDLVIRLYGEHHGTDATGKFMLIELKFGNATPGYAQERTFGLMDSLLRQADPERRRYLGYFIVNYDNTDWDRASFKLNGSPISREGLKSFLLTGEVPDRMMN